MQKVTRLTYSIEEVSRILGISRSHAYKAVETGEIPSIVIGHRKLVSKAVIDEILSAKSNWNRAEGNNHKENNLIRYHSSCRALQRRHFQSSCSSDTFHSSQKP